MHRIIAIPTALLISLAVLAGPSATSRPASAPTASKPAEVPAVPVKRIDAILAKLGSDKYAVRRDARAQLRKIVELPGVAAVLKDRLAKAEDAELRASLQDVLSGHDQPLVMFWCRRAPGVRFIAGAPWLLIRWDGTYIIATDSPLFTGKAPTEPAEKWRSGKFTADELAAVKATINASKLARTPQADLRYSNLDLMMTYYVRSGKHVNVSTGAWPPAHFARKRKLKNKPPLDIALAIALRDRLAERTHEAYAGPLALHAFAGSTLKGKRYTRADLLKLPEWPVEGVSLTTPITRMRGVVLDAEKLQAVRKALTKSKIYKVNKRSLYQAFLAPYDEKAAKIMYPLVK